jgi:hypothetical protein
LELTEISSAWFDDIDIEENGSPHSPNEKKQFFEKNLTYSPNVPQMPMYRAFDDGEVCSVTSS